MKNRAVQIVILLILLGGVGYVIYSNIFGDKSRVVAGQPAPNFVLSNVEKEEFSLEQFRGKGIVLNFWATYCEPCLEEMPALQRQYEKYQEQGIVVIGVNTGENAASVSGYVNRLGVKFPILLDPVREVVKQYGVGPIPHTVFIYPDGTVKNQFTGQMNEAFINKNILELLK